MRPRGRCCVAAATGLRLPGRSVIYGPSGFVRAALDGKPIVLWGDGSRSRDFVLVDDLAEVVFGLRSGHLRRSRERRHRPEPHFSGCPVHPSDPSGSSAEFTTRDPTRKKVDNGYDNSLLHRLLPDFGFTTLEDGISRTLAGFGPPFLVVNGIGEREFR